MDLIFLQMESKLNSKAENMRLLALTITVNCPIQKITFKG